MITCSMGMWLIGCFVPLIRFILCSWLLLSELVTLRVVFSEQKYSWQAMFGCCSYVKGLKISYSCEVSLWIWHRMIALDSSVLQVGSTKRDFLAWVLWSAYYHSPCQPLMLSALPVPCSMYPGCCSVLSVFLGLACMFSFHLIHVPEEEKKKRCCFTSPRKLIVLSILETPPRLQLL